MSAAAALDLKAVNRGLTAVVAKMPEAEILARLNATEDELASVLNGKQPSAALAERLAYVAMFDELPPADNIVAFPAAKPAPDDPVRDHVAMVHKLAEGSDGLLIVASYGYDPDAGADIPARVQHFNIGDVDGMAAAIKQLAAEPLRNVYIPLCVMRPDLTTGRKGGLADIVAVLGLVADFDDDQAANHASRLPLTADYVLETSAGRYQTFHFFAKPLPCGEAAELGMRLKLHASCDKGTSDMSHVWRVPGTSNWPNKKKLGEGRSREPQPVRVVEPWQGTLTDAAALASSLPPLPPAAPQSAATGDARPIVLGDLPDDLCRVIVEGAPVGERSDKFYWAVASLKEGGATVDAVHDFLSAHPDGIAEKYRDRLLKEVNRAYDKAAGRPTSAEDFGDQRQAPADPAKPEEAKRRFTVRMFGELAPNLDQMWTVEDLLPAGGLALLCAKPNQKKTFVAIDLGMSTARGIPWHGRETEQGAVLYISTEGALGARIAAYRKHHKLERQAVPFAAIEDSVNLHHGQADITPLIEAARGLAASTGRPLRLIVVDTLARVLGAGDENSGKDVGAILSNVSRLQRATGATVLLVHHLGKDETRGARGHSSLLAAVDTAFEIKDDVLTVEKQRDGETGARFGFKLIPVQVGTTSRGKLVTSCVIEPLNVDAQRDFGEKHIRPDTVPGRALTVLEDLTLSHGERREVSREEWRDEFIRRHYPKKRKAGRTAFDRAVNGLKELRPGLKGLRP